jgi:type I restriction enzyme S subunit
LGNIVKFEYGKSLPTKKRDIEGTIPVYGSNGIVGYHSESLIDGPSLIVGRKGSIGEVHLSNGPCWPIDTTYFIETHNNIDIKFLYYILKTLKLDSLDRSTAIPGLNRNDAYSIDVFLPPLETQHLIVAILDKAEEISMLRAQADELVNQLLRSTFLDLFSLNNPDYCTWRLVPVQDLAVKTKGAMRTGPFGSNLRHSEFVDSGIAVLGIDNVVNNRFQWAKMRYITEEKYKYLKIYTVYPKDVLITIMGTIGRSCVVPYDIPCSISTKHLAVITCDETKCEPLFLSHSLLFHPAIQEQITKATKGAIMDGLNLSIIKSLKLPLPPIGLQRIYSHIVNKIEDVNNSQNMSFEEISKLNSALMQRAFTEELVT